MTDYRPLNSWNRKTSLLRDRSNSARGQRRRQKTSLAFRHTSVHSDCVRNGCTRERLEYANRPQLCIKGGLGAISSSRCQTTHTSQANPRRAWICVTFWTSEPGCPQRAGALFFRKRSLSGYCGSKVLRWSQAETDVGLKVVETAGNHARQTPSRARAAESPIWWSQTGSNRRPPACKAGALPTELWPLQRSVIKGQ